MERELLLALLLARLRLMKPRERIAFLREVGLILDGWATAPPTIRDNGVRASREAAAAWFKSHWGDLLA